MCQLKKFFGFDTKYIKYPLNHLTTRHLNGVLAVNWRLLFSKFITPVNTGLLMGNIMP